MNRTMSRFCHAIATTWATRRAVISKLVDSDLLAPVPKPGELFNGQKVLLARCDGSDSSPPYYTAQTLTAAALTALFGAVAYMLGTDPEPAVWTLPAAGVMGALAALSLHQMVARRFGPSLIDKERLENAQQALRTSGDDRARPMPVLLTVAMAAMFVIDGAFSGYTLTSTAFASMFSPRAAMAASLAWSCATAWLLYHLTSAAAHESAVNARRGLVFNLLQSSTESDQVRAKAMIEQVGPALGNDFCKGANRIRARTLLLWVVFAVAAATLFVRVNTEAEESAAVPPMAAAETPQ